MKGSKLTSALEAFHARSDLTEFTHNGLLLFALELRFDIDDIDTVAATAITDGPKDRKCDLVYIDEDSRIAVLAQGYVAANPNKSQAPTNKAADLGIAASWVLGNERPDDLEPSLQTAADDLDQAIRAGEVESVELWYSHNLVESARVADELERATATATAVLKLRYPDFDLDVRAREVGRITLDEWYQNQQSPILVTAEIEVPSEEWFSESGDGWNAVCTSVPASWLYDLHREYDEKLFSANVRSYLPRRRSANNINYGIEVTARTNPGRFWAFNNGVTALVNGLVAKSGEPLRVAGMAIVNGAQTTGSISRVSRDSLTGARVMIRFVRATNPDLVQDIIRYNNSQNQIKASDFRSGDIHQKRLRDQFKRIPDATYLGTRRGGPDDSARRPSNLISSDTAAQSLAAFHQAPGVAYHELRSIWERDDVYARYFGDHTSAEHIVCCYSLWRSVVRKKAELSAIVESSQTQDEKEALEFLRKRGSLYLLVAAISRPSEVYLGRALNDMFAMSFGPKTSPMAATEYWDPLVDALLPFAPHQLGKVFDSGGLRGSDSVAEALKAFRAVVVSMKGPFSSVFDTFRSNVSLRS